MLLMFMVDKTSPNYHKVINAAIMMKADNKGNRYVSRLYNIAKIKFSKIQAIRQLGENNTQYGTVWISNFKSKKCIKIKTNMLNYFLIDGWTKKRVIDFSLYDTKGNKVSKNKLYKKSYIEKLRCEHNLTDPIPFKLLNSYFFNRKSNIPTLIGFNILADNIENEYYSVADNLKKLKQTHSYKDIRLKFSIKNDRTITLILKLFDVIK